MRTIKFRVWDKQDKKIIEHNSQKIVFVTCQDNLGADKHIYLKNIINHQKENELFGDGSDISFFDWASADLISGRYEIEQYIGICDINKQEIYEGDILHVWCNFLKIDIKKAEVFWNEKTLRFDVKVRGERYKNYIQFLHQCHWFCEIIGNVHITECKK